MEAEGEGVRERGGRGEGRKLRRNGESDLRRAVWKVNFILSKSYTY